MKRSEKAGPKFRAGDKVRSRFHDKVVTVRKVVWDEEYQIHGYFLSGLPMYWLEYNLRPLTARESGQRQPQGKAQPDSGEMEQKVKSLWPENLTICSQCNRDMLKNKHAVDIWGKVVCLPNVSWKEKCDTSLRVGKRTPEEDIVYQSGRLFGLTEGMAKCDELLDAAFQRGQQAMAEKAAQLGHHVAFEYLNMHRTQRTYDWHEVEDALTAASKAVRSLASAEPPQGEAEKEGRE